MTIKLMVADYKDLPSLNVCQIMEIQLVNRGQIEPAYIEVELDQDKFINKIEYKQEHKPQLQE